MNTGSGVMAPTVPRGSPKAIEIGAVRSGKQEAAVAWANLARVTIDRTGCVIELMPSSARCSLSVDELVDAVLRWFDVVNPQLAGTLRALQAGWPVEA